MNSSLFREVSKTAREVEIEGMRHDIEVAKMEAAPYFNAIGPLLILGRSTLESYFKKPMTPGTIYLGKLPEFTISEEKLGKPLDFILLTKPYNLSEVAKDRLGLKRKGVLVSSGKSEESTISGTAYKVGRKIIVGYGTKVVEQMQLEIPIVNYEKEKRAIEGYQPITVERSRFGEDYTAIFNYYYGGAQEIGRATLDRVILQPLWDERIDGCYSFDDPKLLTEIQVQQAQRLTSYLGGLMVTSTFSEALQKSTLILQSAFRNKPVVL